MTTPTMDEPLTPAEMERLTDHMSPYDRSLLQRALFAAQAEGRKQGLGEAKEVCEAMHDEDRPGDYVAAIEQLEGK